MQPRLIKGNIFRDNRGSVSFVNEFNFDTIKRFYIIENSSDKDTRAWQGHKLDNKNFYCVQGSFLISFVKIDNWDSPSKDLPIESITLSDTESNILYIPAGYANSIKSLVPNSKLISFSTLPLSEIANDDVRYNENTWIL